MGGFNASYREFGYHDREWSLATTCRGNSRYGYGATNPFVEPFQLISSGNISILPYGYPVISPYVFPQLYTATLCLNVFSNPYGVWNVTVFPYSLVTGNANQCVFPLSTSSGLFGVFSYAVKGVWVVSVYNHCHGKFNVNVFPYPLPADVWNRSVIPYPITSNPMTAHVILPYPMSPPGINAKSIFPYPTRSKLPVIHNHDYDILLDDTSIKHLLTDATVTHREDALHNEVDLQCISPDLYRELDPEHKKGEPRIKVVTDGNEEEFLLENIDGVPLDFSIYGVSLSAAYDDNHSYIEYVADEGTLASVIADELIPGIAWNAQDWAIRDEFTWDGSAIKGVKRLADAIKAIIECDVTGSIMVRDRRPVRPIDMQSASYALSLDRSKIETAQKKTSRGDGYNAIDVLGPTAESKLDIQIDVVSEPTPIKGRDAFVRVYYPQPKEPESISTSVSAGLIDRNGVHDETVEAEQVTFESGQGTASKPVISIDKVEWIGTNNGDVTFFPYFKYLRCEGDYGVARITYQTRYHQYRCYGSNVDELVGRLLIPIPGADDVRVVVGTGSNVNPNAITDDLLTTEAVKLARGMAEIDANYYDRDIVGIGVFYHSEIIPGRLLLISDEVDDIVGIYHVKSTTRQYNGPLITTSVECEKCHI
jgi:hypothetical protein